MSTEFIIIHRSICRWAFNFSIKDDFARNILVQNIISSLFALIRKLAIQIYNIVT